MKVTQVEHTGLKYVYKVEIPAETLKLQMGERLKKLASSVKISGFRKGHVPEAILRQRYGDSVKHEVLEKVVNDSSQKALEEAGLRPALTPQYKVETFDESKGVSYMLTVEALPDIQPEGFKDIKLENPVITVGEEKVEEILNQLLTTHKQSKPITSKRAAKKGDSLKIDFEGSVDGKIFPGGTAKDYLLELGSQHFIPGFEEQLEGVKAGESKVVKVRFPENYGSKNLAGKDAEFAVTVHEIQEAVAPTLDDAFAEKMGYKTLAELKEAIKNHLSQEYKNLTRTRVKRELLDALSQKHTFEVPGGMVDLEFKGIWSQFERERVKDPEIAEGKSDEELQEEYRALAERRVKLGLLLGEVGRLNEISVSNNEINAALMEQVRRYPGQEQQVMDFYKKNPEAITQLRAPIYEEKIVDFILKEVQIKDRPLTLEQFNKEEEEFFAAEEKVAKKPAKKAASKVSKKEKKEECDVQPHMHDGVPCTHSHD